MARVLDTPPNERSDRLPNGSPLPPPVSTERSTIVRSEPAAVIAAGPRVRWGGVFSGFVIALGALLLLTVLGLAVGFTALDDPRVVTGENASNVGLGAGIWAFVTLLVACFMAGMVSTTVTDHPDRPGAVIHGALVWVLFSVFLLWLIGSGVQLGVSGLFSALGGVTRGATAAATAAVGSGDLTQSLGLNNPQQAINRLSDPQTVSLFATATGMSTDEARTTLTNLQSRLQAVQNDPEQLRAEVQNFTNQYAERAKQQALTTAARVQEGATTGSWVTFGVLVVTLLATIIGALAGTPSGRQWATARTVRA